MRLHRFIGEFDFTQKTLSVSGDLVSQWRSVLRLAVGDSVILSDGKGQETQAVILDMNKTEAHVEIGDVKTPGREGHKKAELFCALLKRENFEIICQKATELGVSRIIPLITTRTVKTGFNRERVMKIILEACEQSGRTTIPELAEPLTLAEAVIGAVPGRAAFFDLSGKEFAIDEYREITSCFIGPEGGFTVEEVETAEKAGLVIASLGKLTLRGETAAIVASYLVTR